jgi:hypothetical protein
MTELATQRSFGEIVRAPVSVDSSRGKAAGLVVFDPSGSNAGWRSRWESTPGNQSHLSFLGVQGNQASQARRRLTLGAFRPSGQSRRPPTIPQLIDGRSLTLNYTFGIGTILREALPALATNSSRHREHSGMPLGTGCRFVIADCNLLSGLTALQVKR